MGSDRVVTEKKMIVAEREEYVRHKQAHLRYFCSVECSDYICDDDRHPCKDSNGEVSLSKLVQFDVREDTTMVDGIGGMTWDGALVLCRVLEKIYYEAVCYVPQGYAPGKQLVRGCHMLELGSGTGLVGMLAAQLGFRSTVTDRDSDLAEYNITTQLSMAMSARASVSSPHNHQQQHNIGRNSSTDSRGAYETESFAIGKRRNRSDPALQEKSLHITPPRYPEGNQPQHISSSNKAQKNSLEQGLSDSLARLRLSTEKRGGYRGALVWGDIAVGSLQWGDTEDLDIHRRYTHMEQDGALMVDSRDHSLHEAPGHKDDDIYGQYDHKMDSFDHDTNAFGEHGHLHGHHYRKVWDVRHLVDHRGPVDILLGAEITCLAKQQDLLVKTIHSLAESNPDIIILLSFDGAPRIDSPRYEEDMLSKMKAQRFQHAVVYTGEVHWETTKTAGSSGSEQGRITRARILDRTMDYHHDLNWFYFPYVNFVSENWRERFDSSYSLASNMSSSKHGSEADMMHSGSATYTPIPPPVPPDEELNHTHHIIAFFRARAVHTCCRCHKQFSNLAALNPPHACRYHKGMYVCRRHPAETRLSINGLGDNLGYYSNGAEGWDAEFWDCCGAENRNAPGCQFSPHRPYS